MIIQLGRLCARSTRRGRQQLSQGCAKQAGTVQGIGEILHVSHAAGWNSSPRCQSCPDQRAAHRGRHGNAGVGRYLRARRLRLFSSAGRKSRRGSLTRSHSSCCRARGGMAGTRHLAAHQAYRRPLPLEPRGRPGARSGCVALRERRWRSIRRSRRLTLRSDAPTWRQPAITCVSRGRLSGCSCRGRACPRARPHRRECASHIGGGP